MTFLTIKRESYHGGIKKSKKKMESWEKFIGGCNGEMEAKSTIKAMTNQF